MPWTIVNGKETYDIPDRLKSPDADPDTAEGRALIEAWYDRTPRYFDELIIDYYEFHKYCPRKACRRSGKCGSAKLACFEDAEPWLREHVYPEIRRLIRQDEGLPPLEKEPTDYPPEVYAEAARWRAEDAERERQRGRGTALTADT